MIPWRCIYHKTKMILGSTKESGTLRNKCLVLQFDADPSFRFGSVFVYKKSSHDFCCQGPKGFGLQGFRLWGFSNHFGDGLKRKLTATSTAESSSHWDVRAGRSGAEEVPAMALATGSCCLRCSSCDMKAVTSSSAAIPTLLPK